MGEVFAFAKVEIVGFGELDLLLCLREVFAKVEIVRFGEFDQKFGAERCIDRSVTLFREVCPQNGDCWS